MPGMFAARYQLKRRLALAQWPLRDKIAVCFLSDL